LSDEALAVGISPDAAVDGLRVERVGADKRFVDGGVKPQDARKPRTTWQEGVRE